MKSKWGLAAAVFSSGLLVAGAALAQPYTMGVPVAHVGNDGHVTGGGYVGPNGRVVEYAPAAEAVPATPPAATYSQTTWQSENGGMENPNASLSATYTFALNDLYSHGFHHVRGLMMSDGGVQGHAVTPNGNERNVVVNPGSGEISLG